MRQFQFWLRKSGKVYLRARLDALRTAKLATGASLTKEGFEAYQKVTTELEKLLGG